jgi:hypothetical protein
MGDWDWLETQFKPLGIKGLLSVYSVVVILITICFTVQELGTLSSGAFRLAFRKNIYYFPEHYYQIELSNGDVVWCIFSRHIETKSFGICYLNDFHPLLQHIKGMLGLIRNAGNQTMELY